MNWRRKWGYFGEWNFNRIALNAIEKYVSENEQHLTFEEKEARRVLMAWRERV
jgi:hypothetical protein